MNIYEVKALLDVAEAALKFPELRHLHDWALAELKNMALPSMVVSEQTVANAEGDGDE